MSGLGRTEAAKCEATLQAAKAHYEGKLVQQIETDPKRFWNYIYWAFAIL